MAVPFADRLSALVAERRSQICLGLDPDPAGLTAAAAGAEAGATAAEQAAGAVIESSRRLIEAVGSECVAVKPQLACFERLGSPGWRALEEVVGFAGECGLLVVADGKRGDVPPSALAYGQALVGAVETPWGPVQGLGADAFTANPLLGRDAIEPLVSAAEEAGAGVFLLVRTSNPGAADLQDLDCGGAPLYERIAELIAGQAGRLAGSDGTSGLGAVVGATAPEHIARLRELMPDSVFLVPGVGAQGGDPASLGPAAAPGRPGSVLVAASRSIANARDPAAAAADLREAVWAATT